MTADVPSTPASQLRGADADPTVGLDAAVPVRLVPGQVVRADVLRSDGEGHVVLGLQGVQVPATTTAGLEVGNRYSLTVIAAGDRIVLAPVTRQVRLPSLPQAVAGGDLGPGAAALARALRGAALQLELPDGFPDSASPLPDGRQLAALDRALGYDQELRVLQLAELPEPERAATARPLRRTVAARALELVRAAEQPDASRRSDRPREARALLGMLHGVERENAQRAEHRAPLLIPLPALVPAGFADARMFLRLAADAEPAAARPEAGEVSVVLLLELTRLGVVRADLLVGPARVDVVVRSESSAVLGVLRPRAPALAGDLEAAGLRVGRLEFLQTRPGLPVADLLPPSSPSARGGRLDIRV